MITISSIGYVATDITVSANTSVYDVRLAPDTELLDEVVVVGFGTQRKADLKDAASSSIYGSSSVFGANTDAYFPRPIMGDGRNQQTQTRYLQNGAYMRLKNLRIFASAENVWTITSLPQGYDPETAYSAYTGNNSGKTYPLGTTVSLGLNITF